MEDGSQGEPSFEEIARAIQDMMNGRGDIDPALAARIGLPTDPAMLRSMMSQAQSMFVSASNPESAWDQARESARQAAAANSAIVSEKETAAVRDAFTLAGLWLNEATDFDTPPVSPRTYTPRQWVEASFSSFREMTEPIAESVTAAMTTALEQQLPEQMKSALGQAQSMLSGVGQSLFAMQLAQGLGGLANTVLSSSDIGVPLVKGSLGLVPANIPAFAEGLEVDMDQVRIYLALREEAHARLFTRAPWLRSHVFGAIRDFAQGIEIDMERIEELARTIDPSAPESIEQALGGGLFQPVNTPAQEQALKRLETLLALIEGWVDVVVNQAAARLPGAPALAETIRRRRATQGPAEKTFASFVGLELRPRRLRDAAALLHFIEAEGGREARDRIWTHPDLLPTDADLDDPAGYHDRQKALAAADADMDAELEKLLSGGFDDDADPSEDTPQA
jgi:putative hydrolase